MAGLMTLAGPALAQQTEVVGRWDGTNPFSCANQNDGTGTDFPDNFRIGGQPADGSAFAPPQYQPYLSRRLFVGVGGKRIDWLAVSDPHKLRSCATKRLLRRTAAA